MNSTVNPKTRNRHFSVIRLAKYGFRRKINSVRYHNRINCGQLRAMANSKCIPIRMLPRKIIPAAQEMTVFQQMVVFMSNFTCHMHVKAFLEGPQNTQARLKRSPQYCQDSHQHFKTNPTELNAAHICCENLANRKYTKELCRLNNYTRNNPQHIILNDSLQNVFYFAYSVRRHDETNRLPWPPLHGVASLLFL